MQFDNLRQRLQDSVNDREALPEPRRIKHRILQSRDEAQQNMIRLRERDNWRTRQDFKNAVIQFYQDVKPYLTRRDDIEAARLPDPQQLVLDEDWDVTTAIDYWTVLDDALYDLGITKIGISTESRPYGYEFLNGLSFEMTPERPAFKRLQANVDNMTRLQDDDVDIFGVITGGDNRVGKSTMALHILNMVADDVPEEAIVVTPEGFWNAVNEQGEKDAVLLDELTDHFYSKDAMTGDQKKKKQKLKKFAKKNMFLIGTTPNFYNIDREVITDKVKFNVHVPTRGKFEFYTAAQLEQFDRNDDGSADRPSPAFSGGFPKLHGDLWQQYKSVEDEKMAVEEAKARGEEITVDQMVTEIKDRPEYFKKKYKGRVFLNKDLIAANFSTGDKDKIRQAKAKAEADLGLPKDTEE